MLAHQRRLRRLAAIRPNGHYRLGRDARAMVGNHAFENLLGIVGS